MSTRTAAWFGLANLLLAAAPLFAQDALRWETDLAAAQRLAAQTNRLVLVHFWGTWCPPCMKMEQEVFSKPGLGTALSPFYVPVKVQYEQGMNEALVKQFAVEAFPCDIVMTAQGQIVHRSKGAQSADQYVAMLTQTAQTALTQARTVGTTPPPAAAAPYSPYAVPAPAAPNTPPTTPAAAPSAGVPSAATPPSPASAVQPVAAQAPLVGDRYANYRNQTGPAPTAPPLAAAPATAPAPAIAAPATVPPISTPIPTPVPAVAAARPTTAPAAAPQQSLVGDRYANRYATPAPAGPASPAVAAAPTVYAPAPAAPVVSTPAPAVAAQVPPAAAPAPVAPPRYAPPVTSPVAAVAPSAAVASAPTPQAPPVAAQAPSAAPSAPVVAQAAPPSPAVSASVAAAAKPAAAGDIKLPPGCPPLALDGYCPVTVTEKMSWKQGDVKFGAIHRGRTYLFLSAEDQKKFLSDPDRFSPVMSGNDPVVALEQGQTVSGNRKYGLMCQDRMFLFSSKESYDKFCKDSKRYAGETFQAMQAGGSDGVLRR